MSAVLDKLSLDLVKLRGIVGNLQVVNELEHDLALVGAELTALREENAQLRAALRPKPSDTPRTVTFSGDEVGA